MPAPVVERIVAFCARNVGFVLVSALLAGVLCAFYAATHFAINSNAESLISSQTNWRKRNIVFDAEFPQLGNTIDIVIDGATPELAERGAAALAARLEQRPKLFHNVSRPGGGPFFAHQGLLFLPLQRV